MTLQAIKETSRFKYERFDLRDIKPKVNSFSTGATYVPRSLSSVLALRITRTFRVGGWDELQAWRFGADRVQRCGQRRKDCSLRPIALILRS